jgi:hypothetical protein
MSEAAGRGKIVCAVERVGREVSIDLVAGAERLGVRLHRRGAAVLAVNLRAAADSDEDFESECELRGTIERTETP